jgi:hypothetical protein
MKFNFLTLVGVLVIGLGIAALVHPRVMMPGSHREVDIGDKKVIMETRRIVQIPPVLGGLIIICGAGIIFLGLQKK